MNPRDSLRSGQCPRCGGQDVRSGADVVNKRGGHGGNTIPITFWTGAPLDNYVCVGCGFVESYVSDRKLLAKIAETWPRTSR